MQLNNKNSLIPQSARGNQTVHYNTNASEVDVVKSNNEEDASAVTFDHRDQE